MYIQTDNVFGTFQWKGPLYTKQEFVIWIVKKHYLFKREVKL